MNKLYYGDNNYIMEKKLAPASIDLVYLDPPFNSNRNYNLMYSNMTGQPVPEQVEAFCDAWTMDEEKESVARTIPVLLREIGVDDEYIEFWKLWMNSLRRVNSPLMAYLIYMVPRLCRMKRVLKQTGSIYLHCDSTASHYLKIMMDGIFGHKNFRNEIIWRRTNAKSLASKRFPQNHDTILFYTCSEKATFNKQYLPHSEEYVNKFYKYTDEQSGRIYRLADLTNPNKDRPNLTYEFLGVTRVWRWTKERMEEAYRAGLVVQKKPGAVPCLKRYLDEQKGNAVDDIWSDIKCIQANSKERLGYPTQKPVDLLKRIIAASSNPGDTVFDPFCGCGTTVYAAQALDRKWIGCDIAILAIKLVRDKLREDYTLAEGRDFIVDGIPNSVDSARELAEHDRFQFQHWIVERVGGFPMLKKTADKGIDGRLYFDTKDGLMEMVLSVKSGSVKPADVRDLRGVLERESTAKMAGFLCIQPPTRAMRHEAASAGLYDCGGNSYPRIQILTVSEIIEDRKIFNTPTALRSRVDSGQMAIGFDW